MTNNEQTATGVS